MSLHTFVSVDARTRADGIVELERTLRIFKDLNESDKNVVRSDSRSARVTLQSPTKLDGINAAGRVLTSLRAAKATGPIYCSLDINSLGDTDYMERLSAMP